MLWHCLVPGDLWNLMQSLKDESHFTKPNNWIWSTSSVLDASEWDVVKLQWSEYIIMLTWAFLTVFIKIAHNISKQSWILVSSFFRKHLFEAFCQSLSKSPFQIIKVKVETLLFLKLVMCEYAQIDQNICFYKYKLTLELKMPVQWWLCVGSPSWGLHEVCLIGSPRLSAPHLGGDVPMCRKLLVGQGGWWTHAPFSPSESSSISFTRLTMLGVWVLQVSPSVQRTEHCAHLGWGEEANSWAFSLERLR